MRKYQFISDPGHGYLVVPTRELQELGILPSISSFSGYDKRNGLMYLEEDCDAPLFLNTLAERSIPCDIKEININQDCVARRLPPHPSAKGVDQ